MVGSSGRQRVQTDVVQSLKVRIPDLSGQQAIAGVLKILDDKIVANRKVNENLAA
jgi:type I restriction enzyme S subunit